MVKRTQTIRRQKPTNCWAYYKISYHQGEKNKNEIFFKNQLKCDQL